MPKNIVVLSDGTGQDGGASHSTNIYKLFNMAENRTARQTCFYDPGVGTGRLGRYTARATGWGLGRNVRECYQFLFDNFQAGDRIFLFGFSRGAATMRSLSQFIHLFGVLPKSRGKLVKKAWSIYAIDDPEKRRKAADEFIGQHHTMWTKVHFLGCYDTVAALGAPFNWASRAIDRIPGFKHRFHDLRLSPSVVHAFQALALDDQRQTFHPVLWDPIEDEGAARAEGRDELACETMRQVWFAGMHTDVGGGYPRQQLSDIPLVWLTQMAVERGLHIYPDNRVAIEEDPNGWMHDSRSGAKQFYRRRPRAWDRTRTDRPVVHASVLARTRGITNVDEPAYACWLNEHAPDVEPWIPFGEQRWVRRRAVDAEPGALIAEVMEPPSM